jgi:hypothetical protein
MKTRKQPHATPRTETQEQIALVSWWEMAHRGLHVPDARLLFMIPNGSYFGGGSTARGVPLAVIRAAQAKRQGLRPGVPDLMLAVPRGQYSGLFIELKRTSGGVVSDDQLNLGGLLIDQGYQVIVARGFDEAVALITEYLSHA